VLAFRVPFFAYLVITWELRIAGLFFILFFVARVSFPGRSASRLKNKQKNDQHKTNWRQLRKMSSYNYCGKPATAGVPGITGVNREVNNANNYGSPMCGTAGGNSRERVTRILVVGETRVGKTLLIRRLCDHIFGDTRIETSAVDYSPFNTHTAAESATDEDDLGPEWGPTVGLTIDALKRSTTVLSRAAPSPDLSMPSLYPPTPAQGIPSTTPTSYSPPYSSPESNPNNSYGGYPSPYGGGIGILAANNGLQYRGASQQMQQSFHPAPLQQRYSVTQTVEFHELGGTHGYRDIARLPLRNIQYDGVIFVYHRRNLTSTVYLSEWYHWVRSVFSTSAGVSAPGNPHNNSNRLKSMPRFMLVGTQLEGDELTAAAAGVRREVDNTLHIGTIAVSDEALLNGNFALKARVLQSPQTPTHRTRVAGAYHLVKRSLAWPYHVLWCLWHPFFFLSEQYQEERGPRSKLMALCSRVVERCTWLLYKLEQALLYLMAVVLFGPYQEAVVLGHSGTKQTLEELRKDEQCVAQAHVCRLDSDIALQSSLDEIVAFFDILLRED
jgi:hypothetical protein